MKSWRQNSFAGRRLASVSLVCESNNGNLECSPESSFAAGASSWPGWEDLLNRRDFVIFEKTAIGMI